MGGREQSAGGWAEAISWRVGGDSRMAGRRRQSADGWAGTVDWRVGGTVGRQVGGTVGVRVGGDSRLAGGTEGMDSQLAAGRGS